MKAHHAFVVPWPSRVGANLGRPVTSRSNLIVLLVSTAMPAAPERGTGGRYAMHSKSPQHPVNRNSSPLHTTFSQLLAGSHVVPMAYY